MNVRNASKNERKADDLVCSQLISFYERAPEGLLIIKHDVIMHANQTVNSWFSMNLTERKIDAVLDPELLAQIRAGLEQADDAVYENVEVAGRSTVIHAIKMSGGYVLLLHALCSEAEQKRRAQFSAQTIRSLAILFRDPMTTVTTALETLRHRLPGDVYQGVEKYIEIINQRCFSTLKSAEMICEEAEYLCGRGENSFHTSCDICRLLHGVEGQINRALPETSGKITLREIPEMHMVACNAVQIERAIYCVISALLQGQTAPRRVEIDLECREDRTLIHFYSGKTTWGSEYLQFVQKKREGYLTEDIQRYGYDMLRVGNIMELHGGQVMIETEREDGCHVTLVLPYHEPSLHMAELQTRWEGCCTILTQLSDILPENAYAPRKETRSRRNTER